MKSNRVFAGLLGIFTDTVSQQFNARHLDPVQLISQNGGGMNKPPRGWRKQQSRVRHSEIQRRQRRNA